MITKPSSKGARRSGIVALTMAVLIVSAMVPAVAAAAAPENQVKPTIASITRYPHVGTEMTSTLGVWTGSPGFAYQWEHCAWTYGACSAIAGATTSSYIPTSADVAYAMRLKVVATNSEGSTTAFSRESPPITARFAACGATAPGAGVFEDSSCSKTGGTKQYAWRWPSAQETAASGGVYKIRWQWSGVVFGAECANSTSSEGFIGDNQGGMVVTNLKLTLSSCIVTSPASNECKVAGGKVYLQPLSGSAIELGSNPWIELKPSEGYLGTIPFENCKSGFLNIGYPMSNASLYAKMNSENKLGLMQNTLVMQGMEAKWQSTSTALKSAGTGEVFAFRP